MEVMKSKRLEYGSKGVMGGNGGAESWVLMDVGASLSGRRSRGRITQAFSPGYNMTGLRPCRAGVDSASGEVDRTEQWRVGERVQQGKGGEEAVKLSGFSHFETALTRLFPHKSTQVVDFPHLAHVRLFSGGHEIRFSSQAGLGTGVDEVESANSCGKNYGLLREVTRSFTKVRTDQARKSSMLRIFTGGSLFIEEAVCGQRGMNTDSPYKYKFMKKWRLRQVGEMGQERTRLERRDMRLKRLAGGGLAFVRGRDIGMFRAYWTEQNYGIEHFIEHWLR